MCIVMLWLVLCSVYLVIVPVVTANGRLPNNTLPLHYDLHLEATGLGLHDYTYRGNVSIRIAIVSDTNEVVLHNVGNTLKSICLRRCRDGEEISHQLLESEPASELLRIRTDRILRRADDQVITLTIVFHNTLGKDRMGFYRTQYRGAKRIPMAVATTHFQPSYARLAFPCFDEPGFKTTFQITIVANGSHLVASNAPIATVTWLQDGHKAVRFERTPPMQTYLVTFLIANFTSVHTASPSGVEIGILAPPKDKKSLQFSLQAATTLLSSLEEYTGQSLGLQKLDHVAIPQFGNAMENWGLVAYDEQFLVLSAKAHRLQRAQAVLTIGHETAHQLFGNLVGPAWWSYLWLSEGFATYFELLLGADAYPDLLPLEESFAVRHMHPALMADAYEQHPLTVEPLSANTPEIETLFDTITYSKAGCILRMINCSIGEAAFQAGVQNYLEQHRNGIVTPEDLYASFFVQQRKDTPTVEQMFRSWVDKPGYPVVTVERLNGSFVRFRQQRYHNQEVTTQDITSRWFIPITYYTNSSLGQYEYQPAFWMKETDQELVIQLEMNTRDVLVVNPRQIGFYRVEYDERGWNSIVDNLTTLPSIMQAKLIDDAFVLARAGLVGYELCLEMLQELATSPDPVPWLIAMAEENIGYLQRVLQSAEFDRFLTGFVGEMFDLAGNVGRTLLQSQALDVAYDWWSRLAASFIESKRESSIRPRACLPTPVQEVVQALVSPDDHVRERLFARLKCLPKQSNEPSVLLLALNRIRAANLLTPGKLFAVLESLIKSDPGRFLPPTVQFLSSIPPEEAGPVADRFQRLLNLIVHEVTDRRQAAQVRKLMVKNSSILPANFLPHASTVMTSTISWHMKQVPKLREFVHDSHMASIYEREGHQ
ncbi:glutamyl aminopeptidase-like [Anopheles merus]|uniref:Aminopeptidase n=1 Tax=Anopheles merus TaxID=30066 RepID=A0A182V4A3_ANOME|nr:glutamyl aminopeptidase-like [Anopheles merus]